MKLFFESNKMYSNIYFLYFFCYLNGYQLPACLCIHIVRTSFYEYGVYKRQDYVDFPEYIIMDPYLYKLRYRQNDVSVSILAY